MYQKWFHAYVLIPGHPDLIEDYARFISLNIRNDYGIAITKVFSSDVKYYNIILRTPGLF